MLITMSARLFALLLVVSGAACADEASIKKAVESKLQGTKVESVSKAPMPGWYEVTFDGQMIYVDADAKFIMAGSLIDLNSMQNLTEERKRKMSAVKWDTLPLDLAVKTVKGNGKRQLAYFADPNCGYCKQFEKDLAQVNDLTVYLFLFPILTPNSTDKAKAVWCSKDRSKAWNDMIHHGQNPMNPGTCDTPIERIAQLAKKLGVTGTPSLYFQNGQKVGGAVPLAQLEKLLDSGGPQ